MKNVSSYSDLSGLKFTPSESDMYYILYCILCYVLLVLCTFFICIKLFELVRCQPAVHLLMLLLHVYLPDFCTAAQNVEMKHFMMLEKLNVFSALCLDD